jgi:hypothetical protein
VDTKKKELIGNYQNQGRQWRKTRTAEKVNGHDFPGPEVPRAYPYGIYDLARNAGFVNVGTDHDTGAFAAASIRGWWRAEGRRLYPRTGRLLITADGGGSNGWRLAAVEMGVATSGRPDGSDAYLFTESYGNIDDPKHTKLNAAYRNLIGQLATGAKLPIRALDRDNEKRDYPIKLHASFTATSCPFERSDVMRRCLHFEVTNTKIDRMKILNAVIDSRTELLAEYLVRTQNMLKAHIGNADKEYELISGMAEYERFTLICADYEGALADMQAIWRAYTSKQMSAVSHPNDLAHALRLWLGQDPARAGKQYPAETLYLAVRQLCRSLGQKFSYETVGMFGRAIANQWRLAFRPRPQKETLEAGHLLQFRAECGRTEHLPFCLPGGTSGYDYKQHKQRAGPTLEMKRKNLRRNGKMASRLAIEPLKWRKRWKACLNFGIPAKA